MVLKSYKIEKKIVELAKFFLIYGENSGLKKDIIKSILKLKENEKYKKFEFDEETIIKNQNIFYNLVYSGSLFDEKKFVIVNGASDKLFGLIDDISKKNTNDALIFIIAEKLEKKSKVRNLFEKSNKLICIACYQDSNIDLKKIASNELARTKIKLSYESVNLLIERASGDRNNLRNEINKLISFAHNKNIVTYDEVKKLTNLSDNYNNEYIVNLCLSGEKKKLNKTFKENNFYMEDFFILLKIFTNKIHRLIKVKILSRSEKNLNKILDRIKPPIFWKEIDYVKKQNALWDEKKLTSVVNKISKIELTCKKNHEVAINIILDFLSSICDEANNFS